MATLDMSKLAAIITTSPTPILDAMAIQHGVPACLLSLTKDVLSMFPGSILDDIGGGIQEGKDQADSVYKDILRAIFIDTGIMEYDTDKGKFVFVSKSSGVGVEENALQGLGDLAGLGKIIGFGAEAWLIGEGLVNSYTDIKTCIDQMKTYEALQNGPAGAASTFVGFDGTDPITGEPISYFAPPPATEAASLVYDKHKDTLERAVAFSDKCASQLNAIAEVKQARLADPLNHPEPVFNGDVVLDDPNSIYDGSTLSEVVGDSTTFDIATGLQRDPETGEWIIPTSLSGTEADTTKSIINTSGIGPPVAKKGQFLFSRTGIYYDSYGGGLDYEGCITNIVSAVYFDSSGPILGRGVPSQAVKWMLQYNPNLGGKGKSISWNTFNQWVDTVFDMETISEDPSIQEFYDDDHFLQVLIGQRNREVYDLSTLITDYQTEGYGEDSALLINQRQVLYSKISSHDNKINKRKKQIEIHVILSPDDNPAIMGQIPINNLKSLDKSKIKAQLGLQERIMFQPDEVSGIVLPLCPEYIKSDVPQDEFTVEELMVAPVGVGGIINTDKDLESGTSGTVLSLNDHITTDKLVAIYNFLDTDLVNPNSTKYKVLNCTTSSSSEKAAQLVASSIDSTFPSGIGLPYFRGVCNLFSGTDGDGNPKVSSYTSNDEYLLSPYRPYSYARLEGGWNDIDSLLYASGGATIESWVHVPDLADANSKGWNTDSEVSALHRVILGCENRGGTLSSVDDKWIVGPANGDTAVKGLLMGFSRDRRLTQGAPPSNNPSDNSIDSGLVFYMAPTQSVNTSGVTFLNASADEGNCPHDYAGASGFYGITIDTSTAVSGIKFNDVSSKFCLATTTIDYSRDLVSIYLNGVLMKSQSIQATFGIATSPNIPSLIDTSSFQYTDTFEGTLPKNAPFFPPNSLGSNDFWYWNGPQFRGRGGSPPITPWIIGGGYTDGMHCRELSTYTPGVTNGMNFMGGRWGGRKSGLYGFLGSFKLYNKAIASNEVLKNYNGQKGFFENLKT